MNTADRFLNALVPVYVDVNIVNAVTAFCTNNALDPRTFIEDVLRDAVRPVSA